MKIAVGGDHAGFAMKTEIAAQLEASGHRVQDVGAFDAKPSDYPDFARRVGELVISGACERGVLVCGSGVGASIAANKIPGVRAALCHDTFSARQGVEDDDMNVLCLGARVIGPSLAQEVLRAFLAAQFSGAERHVRRVGKIRAIEEESRRGAFDRAREERMSDNPVKRLRALGQSVWYDYIRRDLLTGGGLEKLIREDGLSGMTSNPTIFQKAIAETELYDEDIRRLAGEGKATAGIFEGLAVADVQRAADLFRPTYDANGGNDGFVSIEVGPHLALDTQGTIVEARRLWSACARPNVMVKIPATGPGIPAIRQCLAEGININITLLFSVARYRQVMDAYSSAMEERVAAGKPVGALRSVASFFVSRVDTNADKKLDAKAKDEAASPADRELARKLRGRLGIANARLAYVAFEETVAAPRFSALKAKGVALQRPLWASTSTKDPAYPDLYYVEALVAPDSVDTVPPETLEAYRDHGDPRVRIHDDLEEAREVFRGLDRLGIEENRIFRELEEEGVKKFSDSFDALMKALEKKEKAVRVA